MRMTCTSVAVIHMFKMFLPPNSEFTEVTRIYDHVQDKLYLLYIYVTTCLIANFKQPLWSNQSFV
jgi:hypothetical protein